MAERAGSRASAMVTIRDEVATDVDAIRRINDLAFGQDAEGQLVEALRARGAVLVSLVAESEGEAVGHILFSAATIAGIEGAALAPMAVAPTCQRQGIGSALVRAGLERLRARAAPFVVVLGHPGFYPRFGFTPAQVLGITCDWDVPPEVFMIAVFDPALAPRLHGRAVYQPEFSAFE